MDQAVACVRAESSLREAVQEALEWIAWRDRVPENGRVCIKPNLTFPQYKPGVTTSPAALRACIEVLRQRTHRIAVVESDGGYGAWKAAEAFRGHGLDAMCRELDVELVNLSAEPAEPIAFQARGREHRIALPVRLLHDCDVFVTMPVPKVHCMTYLSLGYKNQWGCVPDSMRLRLHHLFADAIVAINRALKVRLCVGDGTYFLNRQGPMDGDAIPMNLIIAATDPGSFSAYVARLMQMDWRKARHLRRAVRLGDMPADLSGVRMNVRPEEMATRRFYLRRSLRNYAILPAFRYRALTHLYYESRLGLLAHRILYALVGKMEETKARVEE